MQNMNQALAQWLSKGDRAIQLLLEHCRIEPQSEGQALQIHCPYSLFDALLQHIHTLDWQSSRTLVKSVDFYRVREGESSHELSLFAETFPRAILEDQVDVLGLLLLKKLGVNFDQPIAIVEMGTNRPVFCTTGILDQSKAKGLDNWLEQTDMSLYHYPEGLKTLENAAERGIAHGVEWTAKTFDFEPVFIAANVYAGELNGKPVRVNENLHWELI